MLKLELVPAAGDKLVLKLSPPPPLADKQASLADNTAVVDSDGGNAVGIPSEPVSLKDGIDTGTGGTCTANTGTGNVPSEGEPAGSLAGVHFAGVSLDAVPEAFTVDDPAGAKAVGIPPESEPSPLKDGIDASGGNVAGESSPMKSFAKVGVISESVSPSLLGAKACGVKDTPVAKSGTEDVLKKDPAAEKAPDAGAVDSDKAKAMFATHPPAVFWSKFTRPTGPPTAPTGAVKGALKKDIPAATSGAEACVDETGAIKNPALKPATEAATALKPAEAGGAPLPSIKEFPEEKKPAATAASACRSTRGYCGDTRVLQAGTYIDPIERKESPLAEKLAPAGIPDRATRRKKGRKGASAPIVRTKSITPVGGNNRFGALLKMDGNEGILGGTGKVTGGSTPPTADSGATVDVETTTNTTPEGSAAGRFPWSKSYNLLRLFGILALFCLGAAFAHSSCSATSALLSSQRYDSPWPTSPPATVAKPFTPASPNGFCEVGGNDTSSFAAIVSSDSAPANHPVRARSRVLVSAPRKLVTNSPRAVQGGHEDGRSWEALMEAIKEAVGEPLHLIGEPPASVKDLYEKQPGGADLETAPASRNTMERKGEPEIDSIGPVYSSRSGIIVRETVLPVNGTSPEMRSADAGNTPEKLVETGLGAPVSSMHAGGEWRVNRLATASPATTKDLFLQLGRAIDPLLAEPAWPAEVRAAQISDSNSVQSDISSVSRVCADRQPRCAAPVAWHAEPHHALTDERSIDLPSPFHFPFMSGPSSSAPVRTQQRCQFWAALFVLLGACGGVLSSVRRSSSGRLVRCRTGARRGAWLLILAALLPLACAPSDHTSGSIDFQVTVGGGSFQSDVSWDLTCSGALIGSGGAPYSGTLSAPLGECTLNMYDSYGDGWNGDLWKGAGYTFTLGSGSSGSKTSGGTPSSSTGPSGDHTTGSGYYLFTEASGIYDTLHQLESPLFSLQQDATLSFFYHMYGSNMGTLSIEANGTETGWSTLWGRTGDQGNSWLEAVVILPASTTKVRFNGRTGPGWRSDMALDDVSFSQFTPPSPPPLSPGFDEDSQLEQVPEVEQGVLCNEASS
ncbi:hypothetical protein EMIHUDRAFT_218624 [Emiliania huxleyi CCMP1516]|uniref:MAM domain-containing protein n=2 Tax=Emiliania huxleyi TaxID=2903 RepID=A0A0D3I6N2_EMIH1|nr:hypothetical protein EMIHUDRAFT_218624 [Emiliania huxleyi CCMP1516]EOD06917.1 hypothetical protein EMIHUDRAFT_218624 [Emiliania huxleyi CCMP1516]|eukprot:XP_005759346.1 hypothetical protein EMIHUDRAFT_218624 [Emiliania huxleyi CCMP1516]